MNEVKEDVKPILEKKFDPTGYQWMQNGKVVKIDQLGREDLLQIACECMTALERMESLHLEMAQLSEQWRRSEIKPDNAEDWIDRNVAGPAGLIQVMKNHSAA